MSLKYSPPVRRATVSGTLWCKPWVMRMAAFDGNTGAFRDRVSLPTPLSPNYRALVSNGRGSKLVAITGATGNGIAVINLNPLPEPTPLLYLSDRPGSVAARISPPSAGRVSSKTKALTASPMAPRIRREPSPLIEALRARRTAISKVENQDSPGFPTNF